MDTHDAETELSRALAQVQPTALAPELWDRFRDDTVDAVLRTGPKDAPTGRRRLSQIAAFLAEVEPIRAGATLEELATGPMVEGHLLRLRATGASTSQYNNRRAALNHLLRALNGERPPRTRRSDEPHRQGYRPVVLEAALASALDKPSASARAFLRVLGVAMCGLTPPSGQRRTKLVVRDTDELVCTGPAGASRSWRSPRPVPAVVAGEVTARDWELGAAFFFAYAGETLDRRRLELNRLADRAIRESAWDLLRSEHLGRDRTAAIAAIAAEHDLADAPRSTRDA